MAKSILLVGVGGQGTILASKILTEGLLRLGYDVKMSEIHGMAQRGGSVTTQIKFGEKVYSPCIGRGEADVIIAFEKVEAVRWLSHLKEDGTLLVNDYEIYSLPVLLGQEKYPENVIEKLKEKVTKFKALNAAQIAEDLGNIKAQNIVLLGALIKALDLTGYTGNYTYFDVSSAAKSALILGGNNKLAVHCHQTTGGQYIDAGISTLLLQTPSAIENVKKKDELIIFPNPVNNELKLANYELWKGEKIEIFSIAGQRSIVSTPSSTIDVSQLSAGMYIIKAGNFIGKFLKN